MWTENCLGLKINYKSMSPLYHQLNIKWNILGLHIDIANMSGTYPIMVWNTLFCSRSAGALQVMQPSLPSTEETAATTESLVTK